jgi:hypothetical protein
MRVRSAPLFPPPSYRAVALVGTNSGLGVELISGDEQPCHQLLLQYVAPARNTESRALVTETCRATDPGCMCVLLFFDGGVARVSHHQ